MNTQIYEEACNWFVDLRAGDVDGAAGRRFNDWIRKSPEHLRAYLEITEIWQDAPFADAQQKMTSGGLIDAARTDANVVSLEPVAPVPPRGKRRYSFVPRNFALAASMAIVVAGAALFAWFALNGVHTYTTDIGEQRSMLLPDGSTLQMNARSRVQVRFTAELREIELLQGQALFQVAKDAARPFIVRSDTAQIRAVGTQFDVYRRQRGTTVTVVEGRVAVTGRKPLLLSAGEQITLAREIASSPRRTDVASATAWTQRRLILQAATLPEVAEEFNRYNARQMVIADPAFTHFRISGVYSAADPELLLRFLREQRELRVRETPARIIIERRAE